MISPWYVKQLQKLHNKKQWGASGYSHAPTVRDWRMETSSITVLDYGCGRGTLKTELAKIDPVAEVFEYDPGIPGKDREPKPADLLVATDVLEHIEPWFLADTLSHLRKLAWKGAYFTIALTPAKETLPDGRNAHICLLSAGDWLTKLRIAGFKPIKTEMNTKGLWVWAI